MGKDGGLYAQALFPGGVEIPYDDVSLSDQIKRTKTEIMNGVNVIYEAAISYQIASVYSYTRYCGRQKT